MIQALSGYHAAIRQRVLGFSPPPEPANATFLETVNALTSQAVDSNRQAESLSYQALRGKADLTEVIPAVLAAETQLKTVVAFRDTILNAYQQVQRMPM